MAASAGVAAGTLLAGRYRVEGLLGEGGMGAVYTVRHAHTDEHLALKLLHGAALRDASAVERFRREARAPARIDSDHVVRITDADVAPEIGGAPFLVMELLRGRDLEHEVEARGALPRGEVTMLLGQAARALDKAHAIGIVHRDLKPENLFVTRREDGTTCLKILDFGIAKMVGEGAAGRMTATGAVFGSPRYMSPEQARGDTHNVGPRADVWALGLVAFRLLTGKEFWRFDSIPQLIVQIVHDPMPLPSARAPGLGPAFDAWFARCCAREIDRRFGSAGEAVATLEAALGEKAAPGPVQPAPPDLPPTRQPAAPVPPDLPPAHMHVPIDKPVPPMAPAPLPPAYSAYGWPAQQVPVHVAAPVVPASRWGLACGVIAALLLGGTVIAGVGAFLYLRAPSEPASSTGAEQGVTKGGDTFQSAVPIRVGDMVSRVQAVYGLRATPQVDNNPTPGSTKVRTSYHLADRGLWFFFDDGIVATIRVEAPFSGAVDGIRIGDSKSRLLDVKGQPTTAPWDFGGDDAYVYKVQGRPFVRYDVSRSTGRVVTIFM